MHKNSYDYGALVVKIPYSNGSRVYAKKTLGNTLFFTIFRVSDRNYFVYTLGHPKSMDFHEIKPNMGYFETKNLHIPQLFE